MIQKTSPAALVVKTLQGVLGSRIRDFTYVDFCAGAGGPTPFIESDLNAQLGVSTAKDQNGCYRDTSGEKPSGVYVEDRGVEFVLTDIAPHLEAWEEAAKKSDNIRFISTPVDAANAPPDLLKQVSNSSGISKKKIFRLFNLAFHHFDDPLAENILRNSIATSDGFGIFELQARTLSSFIIITLILPLMLLITPFYFWNDPVHLFFTYLVPIIPLVMTFDGYVSSLRTRTPEEIMEMMPKGEDVKGWKFRSGSACHTYPFGDMTWFIAIKEPKN